MVRRNIERQTVTAERPFDGDGKVISTEILRESEMYGKSPSYSLCRLEKGCRIGVHTHTGTAECYFFLRGQGEYNDNGTIVTVYPGDVTQVRDGQFHSLRNPYDEPLEYVVLVLNTAP